MPRAPASCVALITLILIGPPMPLPAAAQGRTPTPAKAKPLHQQGLFSRTRAVNRARAYVKRHQTQFQKAARKAGGQLEIYREGSWRLLVTEAGKFAYGRTDQPGSKARTVSFGALFPHGKFKALEGKNLLWRLNAKINEKKPEAGAKHAAPAAKQPPLAILPDGSKAKPSSFSGGYHGTDAISPEVAFKKGLPGRGSDMRLKEHTEAAGNSAFRGTTMVVYDPVSGNGAAAWAGKGGWVYEVRGVPGWDVNALLDGRVQKVGGGFRGNLMYGEQELAIPAAVPRERIKRAGRVMEDAQGRLRVTEWVENPHYQANK